MQPLKLNEFKKQQFHLRRKKVLNSLHNLQDCDAVNKASNTILNEHDDRCKTILGFDSFFN